MLRTRASIVVLFLSMWSFGAGRVTTGYLQLTVVDSRTSEIMVARVEVLDQKRQTHVPPEALRVAGDCGWFPIHNWIPGAAAWQMRRHLRPEMPNPYTGTTQFYLSRSVRMRLPAGRYTIRAFRGIEYDVAKREAEVRGNVTTSITIPIERWIDMRSQGWYSADDHLHISRPDPTFDATLAKWMEAEDIDVANLLQIGAAHSVHFAAQYKFGKPSIYQLGGKILASGQENPRTHVLGHSITLGASRWLDFPKNYLDYDRVWREARQQGGISGFAHWGIGGADDGLAVWIPEKLVDFLEVFGFGLAYYDSWYELLNLGVRVPPTAGSDYPCSDSIPGRERFYTRVVGPLNYGSWINAVRRGRTFITNGPMIELHVNGAGIGDELHLSGPGAVDVQASVRFDSARDDVRTLELVRQGEVVSSSATRASPGEIRLHVTLPVRESTWLAVRASGEKLGETSVNLAADMQWAISVDRPSNKEVRTRVPDRRMPRPSAAHTAAIFVTITGTPSIAEQPKATAAARRWLRRLDELEALLGQEQLSKLAYRDDRLKLSDLQSARAQLMKAIAKARAAYEGVARRQ